MDGVQEDWDASLSSSSSGDEEARPVTTATGKAIGSDKLTKREQRRLESLKLKEQKGCLDDDDDDDLEDNTEAGRERLVRESDLQHGLDLLGVKADAALKKAIIEESVVKKAPAATSRSIVPTSLNTVKDIDDIARAIEKELSPHISNKLYPALLEAIFRELATPRDTPEVRRLASLLNDLATARQKQATSAKKKPQIEIGIRKGRDVDLEDYGNVGDDFDDAY